ncbi:asparagine synthase (glutamine-hydrolyzing) [Tengunoibacter tsumagoiensis]|uniref:asparagine synthase (glutamine-hydrolyzing) n=1 Tax=Tengunoibacter tsumagoiensis TaxID=2014871 RepID=A0A402A743_9CHLR|nr:asparagine synthase (glutamine-hydrolyzing) [Tengunoibacter tsumagoiensis]GCE14960.1 asparagine synthetase B [Tengunoibacter tsumagoiensis]
MCGICGIIGPVRIEDGQHIERMKGVQSHRGPDGTGFYQGKQGSLGFSRLAIVGDEQGQQPIFNEDASIIMIGNGEIYNYRTLREQLIHSGHRFHTSSDIEVIVHLYEEYGTEAWSYLKGDFAFALLDEKRGKSFLVRDRLGVKPLYVTKIGERWYFASELRALLAIQRSRVPMNTTALRLFFRYRFLPHPFTPFEGIYKLSPGHELQHDCSGIQIRRYWNLSVEPTTDIHDLAQAANRFGELFERATCLQGLNDVPTGIVLSAGLDSSLLLAQLARQTGSLRAYTIDFTDENDQEQVSEFAQAHELCTMLNVSHTRVAVSPQDYLEAIPATMSSFEEPVGDAAAPLLYLLLKQASQDVRVVLAGDGGDELFAGYPSYRHFLQQPALFPESRHVFKGHDEQSLLRAQYHPDVPLKQELQRAGGDFWLQEGGVFNDSHFAKHAFSPEQDRRLNALLLGDIHGWLCDDLLLKLDKLSMHWSIEGRVPYLDHDLLQFAFSLPAWMKLNDHCEKVVMRTYAERILPHRFVHRKKTGFSLPVHSWISGPLRAIIQKKLRDGSFIAQEYVNADAFRTYVDNYFQGHTDDPIYHSFTLLGMLYLEYWHEGLSCLYT